MESENGEITLPIEQSLRERYPILGVEADVVSKGYKEKWTREWFLSEYVKLTDELIGKLDGSIPLNGEKLYRKGEKGLDAISRDLLPPSHVIYLDKSARPIEWMVRSLWPELARVPGELFNEAEVPPMPQSHFLNIDKGEWLTRMDVPAHRIEHSLDSDINMDLIDPELITRIRALYSTRQLDEETIEEAWSHPTIFDGQHVMIVDEVKSSGRTLEIAQMLLATAIPEADFSGQYWSIPEPIYNSGKKDAEGRQPFNVAWTPPWYLSKEANAKVLSNGKGISDRNPDWPEIAEERGYNVSRVGKIGREVLSTPSHNSDKARDQEKVVDIETGEKEKVTIQPYELVPDEKAMQLRQEIKNLAKDLKNHKIVYRPARQRDTESDEEFEVRIKSITGLPVEEWVMKTKSITPKRLQ